MYTQGDKVSEISVREGSTGGQAGICQPFAGKFENSENGHMLTQSELRNLIKKYDVDLSIKPKCKPLQKKIHEYFNCIKNEITSFIDLVSIEIVNEIGYPYLSKKKLLTTYRRIKHKQYRKLEKKELKEIYLISQRITQQQLIENQQTIYLERIKQNMNFIYGLERILKNIQIVAKQNAKQYAFSHDTQKFNTVNNLTQSIFNIENKNEAKNQGSRELMKHKESKRIQKPKIEGLDNLEKILGQKLRDQKSLQKKKLHEGRLKQKSTVNQMATQAFKQITKEESARKKTNETDSPVQKLKSMRMNSLDRQIAQPKKLENRKVYEDCSPSKRQKKDEKKLTREQEKQSPRKKFNERNDQEINEKKQKLIDLMTKNQKKNTDKYTFQLFKKEDKKERNPISDSIDKEKDQSNQVRPIAQRILPRIQSKQKFYDETDQVTQKTIIVPVDQKPEKIKGKQVQKMNTYQKERKNSESPIKSPSSSPQKSLNYKEGQINLELTQNQQLSVNFLVEARSLPAEKAIPLLEKALRHAEDNLSAAEYLSFLYLQVNKPKECLDLCNRIITKLQNSFQEKQMSLIMKSNKGAALNMLGRYSQSIVLLEESLQFKQTDRLYKNLGDAYCSVGIYEKAIQNYDRTIEINDKYDEVHYNLAVCLFLQQNYHQAKFAIVRALQLSVKNPAYLQLQKQIKERVRQF